MIKSVDRKYNFQNLKDVSDKMSDMEYCVFFGTLLGFCREKNLIDGDDDIDLYVNIKHHSDIIALLGDLQFDVSIKTPFFVQGTRTLENTKTYVDFYFYEKDENSEYVVERWNFLGQPNNTNTHLHVPASFLFPLKEGEIEGVKFKVPQNMDACCKFLYGNKYKVPLKKNTQYIMQIVNNKPTMLIKEDPTVPIFVVVRDRLEALKTSLESYQKFIKTPFEIVIHDNASTYGPTIQFLKELEKQGTKVYWNKKNDIRAVNESVKDWMGKNSGVKYYVITDPDVALDEVDGNILDLYKALLDANSHALVVGPMLEIDNLPDHYPLKKQVIKSHYYQFWQHTPTILQYSGKECKVQKAAIDSTFGMYRRGYVWNGPCDGIRTHKPYAALHLDWYLDPDNLSEDQEYYKNNVSSKIGGWGSNMLKNKSHPDYHQKYNQIDEVAALENIKKHKVRK